MGDAQAMAGGNCYMLFETPLTWADARAACNVIGSHLVSIGSSEENLVVDGLFQLSGITATEAWIGLTDQFGEGTFIWAEGVGSYLAPVFTSWDTDQPDDDDLDPGCTECADCAVFDSLDASTDANEVVWYDDDCTETKAYLCEHAW